MPATEHDDIARARSRRRARLVVVALASMWFATGCDECRTWADCEGDGFMACVDGTCQEAEIDEGASCEAASECGEGRFICDDGRCAQVPSCQKLTGDVRYVARCDGSPDPRRGTARTTATGCTSNIASSDAFPFDIPIETIPIDALVVADIGTSGRCFMTSWSALDSTMLLNGCTLGTSTCDVVVRGQKREGAPCIPATIGACEGGLTCEPLAALPGAGVCR